MFHLLVHFPDHYNVRFQGELKPVPAPSFRSPMRVTMVQTPGSSSTVSSGHNQGAIQKWSLGLRLVPIWKANIKQTISQRTMRMLKIVCEEYRIFLNECTYHPNLLRMFMSLFLAYMGLRSEAREVSAVSPETSCCSCDVSCFKMHFQIAVYL